MLDFLQNHTPHNSSRNANFISSTHDWSGGSGLKRSCHGIGDMAQLCKAEKNKGLQIAPSLLPAATENRRTLHSFPLYISSLSKKERGVLRRQGPDVSPFPDQRDSLDTKWAGNADWKISTYTVLDLKKHLSSLPCPRSSSPPFLTQIHPLSQDF